MYTGIGFLTEFYLILGDVECDREVGEREGGHGEGSVRGRLFFLGSPGYTCQCWAPLVRDGRNDVCLGCSWTVSSSVIYWGGGFARAASDAGLVLRGNTLQSGVRRCLSHKKSLLLHWPHWSVYRLECTDSSAPGGDYLVFSVACFFQKVCSCFAFEFMIIIPKRSWSQYLFWVAFSSLFFFLSIMKYYKQTGNCRQ